MDDENSAWVGVAADAGGWRVGPPKGPWGRPPRQHPIAVNSRLLGAKFGPGDVRKINGRQFRLLNFKQNIFPGGVGFDSYVNMFSPEEIPLLEKLAKVRRRQGFNVRVVRGGRGYTSWVALYETPYRGIPIPIGEAREKFREDLWGGPPWGGIEGVYHRRYNATRRQNRRRLIDKLLRRKQRITQEGAFSVTEEGLLEDREIAEILEGQELTDQDRKIIAERTQMEEEELRLLEQEIVETQRKRLTKDTTKFMTDYLAEVESGKRPESMGEMQSRLKEQDLMDENLAGLLSTIGEEIPKDMIEREKEREKSRAARSPLAWEGAELSQSNNPLPRDPRQLRELEEDAFADVESEFMLELLTGQDVQPTNNVTEKFSWLLLDKDGGLIQYFRPEDALEAGAKARAQTTLVLNKFGESVPITSVLGGIDVRLDRESGLVIDPSVTDPELKKDLDAILSGWNNPANLDRDTAFRRVPKSLEIRVVAPGRVYVEDGEVVGFEVESWETDDDNTSSDRKVRSGGNSVVYFDGKGYELDDYTKLPARLQQWELAAKGNDATERLFLPVDRFSPYVGSAGAGGVTRAGASRINPPTRFVVTPGTVALERAKQQGIEFRNFATDDSKEAFNAARLLASDYGVPFFILEGVDVMAEDPEILRKGVEGVFFRGIDYGPLTGSKGEFTRRGWKNMDNVQAVIQPDGAVTLPEKTTETEWGQFASETGIQPVKDILDEDFMRDMGLLE